MSEEKRKDLYPRWASELIRYLPIKTAFFLYGNIYDRFPWREENGKLGYLYLARYLSTLFHRQDYDLVGLYDMADHFVFPADEEGGRKEKENEERSLFDQLSTIDSRKVGTDGAMKAIRTILRNSGNKENSENRKVAMILDYAWLLLQRPDSMSDQERRLFLQIAKCSQEAATGNVLVLISNNLSSLPAWLYLDNPLSKTIELERPTEVERREYLEAKGFREMTNAPSTQDNERLELVERYANLTHGLLNRDLLSLVELSKSESIDVRKPNEVIERFKFGVRESPWEAIVNREEKRRRIQDAERILEESVKGQDYAIRAVTDVIKRATQGLSGVQHSSKGQKPKGILFFAGPTGVGKTELAKAVARLLFDSEDACIRFDMSEYGQEHSDQRLFGAPPGYVGYEEGGQLTNKVKANPFSVLLFDEIEKAHPKILDKFLQILEDGRLTSGQGETVYFSECIIIFTSNKGIYRQVKRDGEVVRVPIILPQALRCKSKNCGELLFEEEAPRVCTKCDSRDFEEIATPYEEIRKRVKKALEEYFKLELERPEIYNRFGNNFIVFDFIRPEVMKEIIAKMITSIQSSLREKRKITVAFSEETVDQLFKEAIKNPDQGGRGVGNLVETQIINPLARYLFDHDLREGSTITVAGIRRSRRADSDVFELVFKQ